MIVEAQVCINGSKQAIWAAITDIENAAKVISGIEAVEVLERPESGWVGVKWRETRTMFGKQATEVMWVTEAVENEFYTTRAESHGFVYLSTVSMVEQAGGFALVRTHVSKPQGFVAKLMSLPMGLAFRGVMKKCLMQDLNDIKAAVEKG
ncbi:MAG: hypothetical protein ACI9F9_003009 [Candidatus Paceibacteria bacterium]|jgi:hypothetical protein